MILAIKVLIAYLMDVLFGDPMWIPHPIIYIGKLISALEKFLRAIFPKTPKGEFISGTFLWILTVGISFIVPFTVLYGLYNIASISGLTSLEKPGIYLASLIEVFWCFQILAAKTLELEALKIKKTLEKGDLTESRKALSMIVGRDTSSLSEEEITKAVIETVSENTTDGIVAPLMFMVIGGAPLGFLYKAVNTLDSMVGYKNDKYFYFGKLSAILDDVFNYIPARITGFAMVIGSHFIGLKSGFAFKMMMRDHSKHASPNGGWTEAATAGALNIALGGDAFYFGKLYKKATLGDANERVTFDKISDTTRLMWVSSITTAFLFIIIRIILEIFI